MFRDPCPVKRPPPPPVFFVRVANKGLMVDGASTFVTFGAQLRGDRDPPPTLFLEECDSIGFTWWGSSKNVIPKRIVASGE